MNKGILIFAHNNENIDYTLLAFIAAKLANKHLKQPVSLITDPLTFSSVTEEQKMFYDKIIIISDDDSNNVRKLHDGTTSQRVKFLNGSRSSVWEATPYDRTLLIDSDYLIFSDRLSNYWDVESDLMIGSHYNDIIGEDRIGYHDKFVSDTGVKMYWATTVMFTKNEKTKKFFDLVNHIKENYQEFADVYQFDSTQYRNDISFSIAKHIFDGFETSQGINLPGVLSATDKDILHEVANNRLKFLVSPMLDNRYVLASIDDTDIHVMNKQSILRNAEQLLEMSWTLVI